MREAAHRRWAGNLATEEATKQRCSGTPVAIMFGGGARLVRPGSVQENPSAASRRVATGKESAAGYARAERKKANSREDPTENQTCRMRYEAIAFMAMSGGNRGGDSSQRVLRLI